MADAESSSITNSSLAPSTTPTSILDSLPPHSSDRTASTDKVDRRASLGLIDAARVRFSKDFSSLLRSNSKSQSQRIRTVLSSQTEDPENEHPLYPNYVKLASHTVDLHLQTMDDSPDERPGRGFGARIVNFLNRSRSRSRSKKRRSRSLDAFPADPMPTSTAHLHSASLRLHARHSSLETDQDALVAGPSRPITRSPSRPLSGTAAPAGTSAKPRSRRVPEQIAVHNAAPTATAEIVAQVVPVEQTKSSSSKKGKTFNIFNILLSSPKKGSFSESARGRSRPNTPTAAASAPPPPPDQQLWHGSDNRAWEVKSGSNRSQKSTRKALAVDMGEDREAQCLPYKSADGRSAAVPGLIVPQPRRAPIHVLNSPPPMPRGGYSNSGRVEDKQYEEDDRDAQASVMEGRCSPLCGFGGSSSKGSHASQEKGKEKEKERMRGARERSWERERGYDKKEKEREKEKEKARERRRDKEKEKEREHITHPRRVGSPLPRDHRPRESTSAVAVASAVAPVLPLEKTTSNRSAGSKNSAGKEHHGHGHPPRSGVDGVAARAKRIKHGSFDFERPVSAGVGVGGASAGVGVKTALRNMGVGDGAAPHPLQRSLSARGTSRRGTDESLDRAFAPSSVPNTRPILDKGKGKQGHDVHFADPPSRRATDNSHSSSGHPSHHHHHHTQSSSSHHRTLGLSVPNQHPRDAAPASPISTNSGNSSSQNHHTRDGSWGRSGGKRIMRASHGPFKFEPAVPPIPGSPADNERRATGATSASQRPESPLSEKGMSRSKQARAAGKGRSLDLGLGLSWAPSTVRAEAVLRVGVPRRPGTSAGTSASTSAARSKSRWRGADEEGRLTAGAASDVAAAFREALGDSAYGIFKNYVHRFDANAIPLDGPYGLLAHIERLLDDAPGVDQRRKRVLLERLLRVVQDSENR